MIIGLPATLFSFQVNRVIIKGYRRFDSLDMTPNPAMNIMVGDNESGKSTLLEAVALTLTGKANGRWAGPARKSTRSGSTELPSRSSSQNMGPLSRWPSLRSSSSCI